MRLIAALLLCLGLCFQSLAQDWNSYQPLKSKGDIPADFTEAYTNKYNREKDQIDEDAKRRDRKRENDFHLRSEYQIDEFLISGEVIFGDTITEYCNRILNHLLKDDQELREKLRIYVVKTPEVNAYATANGIIFINLGLIAQVENEAQLAYIIAHEVIHFKNDHVLNQYIEQEKISRGEDLYKKTGYSEKLNALSSYSKNLELEADGDGFNQFFKKSGYAHSAPIYVMDVLQYSYLPFDELKFEPTFFETQSFKIPQNYLLESTAAITAEADYDDSRSTHPNIKTRKLEILKKLNPKDTGVNYLISKPTFDYSQRLARYEISRLYLNNGSYASAIYHTFLLQKKYGEDKYQKLTVAKALTAASVYRNEGMLYKIIADWKDIEGASQQVFHIFEKFEREDLNTLAVAYTYELYRQYPDDKTIKVLFSKALRQLVFENDLKPSDFISSDSSISSEESLLSLLDSVAAPDGGSRSSKIARIQQLKKEQSQKKLEREEYYRSAFVNYWNDSLFSSTFDEFANRYESMSYSEKKGSGHRKKREKYDPNYSLGIDSILCVSPEYAKLDERKKDGIKYLSSEERQEKYREELLNISNDINLHTELLDYKDIQPYEVDKFNDLSLIKNWIDERLMHENVSALVSDFNYMEPIIKKYGTPYVSYTGNLSLRVKERNVAGRLIYSALLIYPFPFMLTAVLIPDHESFNFYFLFDLTNGDALLAEYNYYETNDGNDYLQSIIYNNLIQVKAK